VSSPAHPARAPLHRTPAPSGCATAIGDDPTAEPRALRDAIRSAIADRQDYGALDVDAIGWWVDLLSPERQDFHGGTLEEALAWCLVWLMVEELGVGPAT
jgi:hypothetical protein